MTQIFAHRGASGYAPENTMAAFEMAAEMGAHGIETDIHLTKDGKLAVTHDPVLGRTISGEGIIRDMTHAQLRELDCGAWYGEEFAGERVPELKDLLPFVKEKDMVLNIEIKMGLPFYSGLEEALAEELARWNMDERLIVSSFNHNSLKAMERLRPSLRRGFLTVADLIDPEIYVEKNGGHALHPHFSTVTPELVKAFHDRGMKVNPYTVDEEAYAKMLIEAGVDCLITNYPDRMLKLI